MAAGDEGVGGGRRVQIEARLAAQPQRNVGASCPTHGALAVLNFCLQLRLTVASPGVVAMHVAAAHVSPGLLLVQHLLAAQAGKGQGVETYGALGPSGIELLSQRL